MNNNKKIRVLECIRQGQIGGGESHLLSLVENLDRAVFDPVVLSFTDGPMIERLEQMKVPVHIIHTVKPFDVSKWKEVKEFIREQNVDLIHVHGTRANSNVLWAARSLNIPVIYTIHGWSFHQDQSFIVRKVRVLGEKYLTAKSDINISVSVSNKESGKKYIPRLQSIVINNGIDQRKFNPSGKFADVRKELGISSEKTVVLFIARFTSHKQPLSLIEAFLRIAAQNHKLHLLMVGDGDQKQEALSLIATHRLKDQVTLLPFRQDVPDVLAASDIFVLPSLWEGLPIGLLEAMSMGKAIIATNVDGTNEIIQHDVNGYLINTENLVNNLTDALLDLANNPEKRQQFATSAIATVRQRFNAETMTRSIEKVYKTIHAGEKAVLMNEPIG